MERGIVVPGGVFEHWTVEISVEAGLDTLFYMYFIPCEQVAAHGTEIFYGLP